MRSNFESSLKAVLVHEGGFSNHPDDPGGATMRGVTQRVYDAYRQRMGLGTRTVKLLADDELRDIYKKQYWDAVRGDELPSGIDYCVFDFAVNSGPVRAVKYLQMALGIAVDGVAGQQTLRAAEEAAPNIIVTAICDRRMHFLKNLSTFPTFGRGWTKRVDGVRKLALEMADMPAPKPFPDVPVPETTAKETTMNVNMLHNILNAVGLVIGALITFDWTAFGFSAEQAALFAGWVLIGDKVIKFAMNIFRDGLGGLFKVQPPVIK